MAELSIQQKKAIALAKARKARDAQNSPSTTFLNRGISSIAGAPVDLVNAALGIVGLGSEQPFGGSASIEQGIRNVSDVTGLPQMVPGVNEQPDTAADYIFRGIGEAGGALVPMFAGASAMSRAASPVVSGIGRSLTASPITGSAAELAAGAGAGAGRYVGEQAAPEGQENLYGMLGELAGGLSAGGAIAAPGMAMRGMESMPLTGTAIRAARGLGSQVAGAVLPSTSAGAFNRASNRLRSLVADPEQMADAVRQQPISDLTPAQRTGSPRLLALERAIRENDPTIDSALGAQQQAAQGRLASELMKVAPGQPADTRQFLEGRIAGLRNQIVEQVQSAQSRAQQRLSQMQPAAARTEAPRILREEFDAAYETARQQENDLWRQVPEDVQVPTQSIFDAYDALVASTPRTQRDQIPDYAKRFFDRMSNERLADMETPAELQGARSQLLEISRNARAAGQRNTARLADNMAEDILRAMNQSQIVSEPYQAARDYSRMLNETFRDGEIGRLTQFERTGEARIAPELTAEATIGRGGERGAIAQREFVEAQNFAGRSPDQTVLATEDYVRQQFMDSAMGGGTFSRAAASRFLTNNETLLRNYPNVRREIEDIISSQARATSAERAGQRRISGIENKSAASRYLSGDVNNEIQKVLRSQNPQGQAREIFRQVSKDPSGKALAGLKSGITDNLIASASRDTPDGTVLQGSKILAEINRNRPAISEIMTPQEISRLEGIGRELVKLERAEGRLPQIGSVMDDLPNEILSYAARVAGARAGASLGGGSMAGGLQSAQMMSGRVKRFMERLTNDRAAQLLAEAVNDPELYAALLSPTSTTAQAREAGRRLNAWLLGPGIRFLEEDEE